MLFLCCLLLFATLFFFSWPACLRSLFFSSILPNPLIPSCCLRRNALILGILFILGVVFFALGNRIWPFSHLEKKGIYLNTKMNMIFFGCFLLLTSMLLARVNCFWPFCTGTHVPAFLDTTFGMSIPEVNRALKVHSAQIVDYESYKSAQTSPQLKQYHLKPLFSEETGRYCSLFMPSIKMFDAKVEAEFSFSNGKLHFVKAQFDPVYSYNTTQLIFELKKKLEEQYTFIEKKKYDDMSGTYALIYSDKVVEARLIIDPNHKPLPKIVIYLIYLKEKKEIEDMIAFREEHIFT